MLVRSAIQDIMAPFVKTVAHARMEHVGVALMEMVNARAYAMQDGGASIVTSHATARPLNSAIAKMGVNVPMMRFMGISPALLVAFVKMGFGANLVSRFVVQTTNLVATRSLLLFPLRNLNNKKKTKTKMIKKPLRTVTLLGGKSHLQLRIKYHWVVYAMTVPCTVIGLALTVATVWKVIMVPIANWSYKKEDQHL
eukprot:TRINITY_DN60505_c0_g1_i1.p2 TRINITY_DN60505_c0_g1~~TRINITY_DN60505_c0_g1_i1.p2  ORF type:complete len:196 (-),score=10.27 TRINITY_DN60505_c0_g1_i1:195-782(-)